MADYAKPNFGPGYSGGPWKDEAGLPAGMLDIFDAAKVTQERGAVYGHPADDFARVALIKGALSECPDARMRHVLEMIAVKMARLVHSPNHLDSWIDIAGYARTAVMIMDRDASPKTQEDKDAG